PPPLAVAWRSCAAVTVTVNCADEVNAVARDRPPRPLASVASDELFGRAKVRDGLSVTVVVVVGRDAVVAAVATVVAVMLIGAAAGVLTEATVVPGLVEAGGVTTPTTKIVLWRLMAGWLLGPSF